MKYSVGLGCRLISEVGQAGAWRGDFRCAYCPRAPHCLPRGHNSSSCAGKTPPVPRAQTKIKICVNYIPSFYKKGENIVRYKEINPKTFVFWLSCNTHWYAFLSLQCVIIYKGISKLHFLLFKNDLNLLIHIHFKFKRYKYFAKYTIN